MKTPLHATLFLLKPKGNFVFKLCSINRKDRKAPQHMHIFSPFKGMIVSSLFIYFFFKKTKEALNPKVKILCPERLINIYIVAQKTRMDHFILNHSFNTKCITWKRQSYPQLHTKRLSLAKIISPLHCFNL